MAASLAFLFAGTLLSPFFLDWYAPGYYRLYPNDIISLGNKTALAPLSSFGHVVDVAAELQRVVQVPTVTVDYVTVTMAMVPPAVVAPKVVEVDGVPEHAVASASLGSTLRIFDFLLTTLQSPFIFLAIVLYDLLLLAFSVHDFLHATASSLVKNVLARQIGQYSFFNLLCAQVRDHADAVVRWFCFAAGFLLTILITKVSTLVKNLFKEVGEHRVALVSLNTLSAKYTALRDDHDSLLERHKDLSTDYAILSGSHASLYEVFTKLSESHDDLDKIHGDNIKHVRKEWNKYTFQTTRRFKDGNTRAEKAEAKIAALETALNQLRIERAHDRDDFTNLLNLVEMGRVAMVILPGHSRPTPMILVARPVATAFAATASTATRNTPEASTATSPTFVVHHGRHFSLDVHPDVLAASPDVHPDVLAGVIALTQTPVPLRSDGPAFASPKGSAAPNPFFWGAPGVDSSTASPFGSGVFIPQTDFNFSPTVAGSSNAPPFGSNSFVSPETFDFSSLAGDTSPPFSFSGNGSTASPAHESPNTFNFSVDASTTTPPTFGSSNGFSFSAGASNATPPPSFGFSAGFNFGAATFGPTAPPTGASTSASSPAAGPADPTTPPA